MLNNIVLMTLMSTSILLLFSCVDKHKTNIYLTLNAKEGEIIEDKPSIEKKIVTKQELIEESLPSSIIVEKEEKVEDIEEVKKIDKESKIISVKRVVKPKVIETRIAKVEKKEIKKEKSLSDLEKAILEEMKKMEKGK